MFCIQNYIPLKYLQQILGLCTHFSGFTSLKAVLWSVWSTDLPIEQCCILLSWPWLCLWLHVMGNRKPANCCSAISSCPLPHIYSCYLNQYFGFPLHIQYPSQLGIVVTHGVVSFLTIIFHGYNLSLFEIHLGFP